METAAFMALAAACAPLVHPLTAQAIVRAESAFNPYAIGVVGGALSRQPRTRDEAIGAATTLRSRGFDFSVGLGQINVRNLPRLGLDVESAFDPCNNLRAMQVLLVECFDRAARQGTSAQRALRQAFSCYYSGNFVTGFKDGYVDRVVRLSPSRTARSSLPHSSKEIS